MSDTYTCEGAKETRAGVRKSVLGKVIFEQKPKERRERAISRAGKSVPYGGTASAKAPRQGHAWCVGGTARDAL